MWCGNRLIYGSGLGSDHGLGRHSTSRVRDQVIARVFGSGLSHHAPLGLGSARPDVARAPGGRAHSTTAGGAATETRASVTTVKTAITGDHGWATDGHG